jgi:hypothetical protein
MLSMPCSAKWLRQVGIAQQQRQNHGSSNFSSLFLLRMPSVIVFIVLELTLAPFQGLH